MSNLIKKPFQTEYLDADDKRVQDICKVRLNIEEREVVEWLKQFWNTPQDSTAIKWTLEYARNVLHSQFPTGFLKTVHSGRRNKLL